MQLVLKTYTYETKNPSGGTVVPQSFAR